MTTITANGASREVVEGSTVLGFLESLGWRPEWVVVEHNGEPLDRRAFSSVVLRDGDRVEVVRAVAGGAS